MHRMTIEITHQEDKSVHKFEVVDENNLTNKGTYQGLNSINLLKEDNRWIISNLKWNQEIDDYEALKEYLPNSQN